MRIYDIPVTDREGRQTNLTPYEGKLLLIVNTATACGFTPQYEGLQKLYDKYHSRGFEVLDFPSNQFGRQSPGTMEEIDSFCALHYQTGFPRFYKVDVNGENAAPLFQFLKKEKSGVLGGDIEWNFAKFLVDRQGKVVRRYAPNTTPEAMDKEIEELI